MILPEVSTHYIIQDIIHKNNKIYVDTNSSPFVSSNSWMPNYAIPKVMKNGEVVYHCYFKEAKPDRDSFVGRKRRFIFSLMLNNGNPTWKSADDFINWLYEYENCKSNDELKLMICGTWCKRCKTRRIKEDDTGGEALSMLMNGYK